MKIIITIITIIMIIIVIIIIYIYICIIELCYVASYYDIVVCYIILWLGVSRGCVRRGARWGGIIYYCYHYLNYYY